MTIKTILDIINQIDDLRQQIAQTEERLIRVCEYEEPDYIALPSNNPTALGKWTVVPRSFHDRIKSPGNYELNLFLHNNRFFVLDPYRAWIPISPFFLGESCADAWKRFITHRAVYVDSAWSL